MKTKLAIVLVLLVMVSCGPVQQLTRKDAYAGIYEEKPLSILVMPPINYTSNVEAKDLLYTSISYPLAEAGYYVISPNLSMDILKNESAYDAENFINASLVPFKKVFGCDAVVFSEIHEWTKSGFGIDTKLHYIIKMADSGEVVFDRTCDLRLNLQQNSGGSGLAVLIDLAVSAINTAMTKHIVAARSCNAYIFKDIPKGKYNPNYLKDQDIIAEDKDIKVTL